QLRGWCRVQQWALEMVTSTRHDYEFRLGACPLHRKDLFRLALPFFTGEAPEKREEWYSELAKLEFVELPNVVDAFTGDEIVYTYPVLNARSFMWRLPGRCRPPLRVKVSDPESAQRELDRVIYWCDRQEEKSEKKTRRVPEVDGQQGPREEERLCFDDLTQTV